jgi:SAM-dependent methyltransferase
VPSLDYGVREYRHGPNANVARMLASLEPLGGQRVVDVACGIGVVSAWLAARGALVTGIDVSAAATRRAAELCEAVGVAAKFVTASLERADLPAASADRVAGRYALHHLDLPRAAPVLGNVLAPGGKAAFVETMATNPILRFTRGSLAGRFGIAMLGSPSERPLSDDDLALLERHLGRVEVEVAEMMFLRVFDRNVLRYRHARASRLLGAIDDALFGHRGARLSYHQVLVFAADTRRACSV